MFSWTCLSQQPSSPWHLGAGCSWGVQQSSVRAVSPAMALGKGNWGCQSTCWELCWNETCPAGMQILWRQIPCGNTSHTWCTELSGLTSMCIGERDTQKPLGNVLKSIVQRKITLLKRDCSSKEPVMTALCRGDCSRACGIRTRGQGLQSVARELFWRCRERCWLGWWRRQTGCPKALVLSQGSQGIHCR